MDIIQDLKRKKLGLNDLQTKKNRLEGQYDQQIKDLTSKFGVSTIDSARNLLTKLEEDLTMVKKEGEVFASQLDSILICK